MQNPSLKLFIASKNPGKIREIKKLLDDLAIECLSFEQIDIRKNFKVKETGKTFARNASLKATKLGKKLNLLTLADDSGLEVDALGKFPGITSARFAKGGDKNRINRLLNLVKGIPWEKRTARFRSAVAIFDPKKQKAYIFEAKTEGYITNKPIGKRGFAYDPIFYSNKLGKTFAQATIKEKNQVSHRGRALRKAKKFLRKLQNKN